MKKYLSSFVFLLSVLQVFAQTEEWEWCRSFGGIGTDEITCSVLDNYGNTFFAGYFYKELDLDNYNLNANGDYDAFVAKIDVDGNILWAKSIGGGYNEDNIVPDYAVDIFIDRSGNACLTGIVHSCSNIDTFSLKNTASSDIFFIKMNPEGKILLADSFGNESNDILTSAYYNEGNLIFAGTQIIIDAFDEFKPITYLISYNSEGNLNWGKKIDFFHQSSQIKVDGERVIFNLTISNNESLNNNKSLNFVYDNTGNIVSSEEVSDLFKSSPTYSQGTIIFSKDTILNDTMLYIEESWQKTAFVNEFNNVDMIIPGKVINDMKLANNRVIAGNYFSKNICENIPDFTSIDFFIAKGASSDIFNYEQKTNSSLEVKIFPNPSSREFNVTSSSEIAKANVTILNSYSQIVREYNSISLPFSVLVDKSGFYFIKVIIGDYTFIEKVVKL